MNWLINWFINNSVGANLLMIAILASGAMTFHQLRIESFPQIAPSSILITVAYPGGTAKQIDQSVTQRIEESISSISGIKHIASHSTPGLSTVVVSKTNKTELNKLLDDIRNNVNAINGFPNQAERPQIIRDEFTNLSSFVVVSGPRSNEDLQPIARQIELALKNNPNISKVSNWGRRAPQLAIEPDPAQLEQLGLNLEDLSNAIEAMSLEIRTGELSSDSGRMIIRGDGYADNLQKLRRLAIVSRPSGTIYLGDIAKITRGYESSGSIVRNNGMNAIALLISNSQTDNLLKVNKAVEQVLAEQRKVLPSDIQLNTMANMAPYIKEQLFRLGNNAWQGFVIVIVLLGIFLDLKLAFWVATGIPVAIAGTLAALQLTHYSINDITLFGFILVLGILVDDAVVVGEAIHEHRKQHNNGRKAAMQGVHSVSVATVFGVLTTIAAFSPMLWIDNELAKILAGFSVVVILALLFSLIESKFILPSHLAQISGVKGSTFLLTKIQSIAQKGLDYLNHKIYKSTLVETLNHKLAILLVFTATIILAYGMWSNGTISSAMFPEIPGRYITAKVELEDGAPLPLQSNTLNRLEKSLSDVQQTLQKNYPLSQPPIVNLLSWSDGYGQIEVTAELTSEALSILPAQLLTDSWRTESGEIEGGYSVEFSASETPAGETFMSVASNDMELAKLVSKQVTEKLITLPGVTDVYDDSKSGIPQVRITLNEYGQQLGLSQERLARLAGEAFGEREIHRILDQGQETKVLLRYPLEARKTLTQLKQTMVLVSNSQYVSLGDIADFRFEQEAQTLYRRNREQVVNLYWKQNREVQAPEQTLSQLKATIDALHQQYPTAHIKAGGEFEEIEEVSDGFRSAMLLTLLLIYILLAVPLKSYWQPLIIMAVIPFGFAGAIFGHYLMSLPISLLSMFGMMAMTGIVINDSLVLITRFNTELRNGVPLKQALIIAGTSRFKAIFLTTITTVCGLVPLLSETSEQAQYLKPAAVSLVFGELFATVITLFLVPILLVITSPKNQKAIEADLITNR